MIKFTSEQLDIINSPLEGNMLVSASAGGSKSTTLVQRVKHMIDCGVNPSDICIISYTKESANDLKKKLTKLNIEGVSCSTLHSLAFKICLKNDYSLSDKVIKQWQIDNIFYKTNKNIGYDLETDTVMRLINYQKCNLIGVNDDYKLSSEGIDENVLRMYYKSYEEYKHKEGLIDFNDMVIMAIEILKNRKGKKLYKYIIGDEFQDSSPLSYAFLDTLSNKENVTLFADVKQSIYGFLSAKPELIETFPNRYPNTKIFHLSNNFRSCYNIVESANNFIEPYFKSSNSYKRQIPTIKTKGKIFVNKYEDGYMEGISIINKIKKYKEDGVDYKDIMVLFRNNSQSNTLQLLLKSEKIPFIASESGNMFKYNEISNIILPMLKLMFNRNLDIYVDKIIDARYGKFKYMKKSSIEDFRNYSTRTGMSLYQSMLEYKGDYKLMNCFEWFTKQLDGIKLLFERDNDLNKLINNIISMFDLINEINNNNKYNDDKKESIRNAISVILSASKTYSIYELIHLMEDEPKKKTKNKEDGVKLLTVHSSKGLESKICFVMGVDNTKFPSAKNDINEEARLFYVATTRAIDELIITSSDPSKFIYDYEECIDK